MPEIVAFDTNILFSSLGWKGKPYECVELARAGAVEGLTCQGILDELADKVQEKLGFSEEQVAETLVDLLSFLRVVDITGTLRTVSADPDDDKIVECAVLGGATHLVTGDRKHLLPLGTYNGIRIVSATEFLSVTEGKSEGAP